MTELEKALETARELDRLTKENPCIIRLLEAVERTGGNLQAPMEKEQLVTAKDIKRMLGITDTTLARLVRDGHLKPIILPGNKKRQYRLALVNEFVKGLE